MHFNSNNSKTNLFWVFFFSHHSQRQVLNICCQWHQENTTYYFITKPLVVLDFLLVGFSSFLSTQSLPIPLSLAPNMPLGHICFIFFPLSKQLLLSFGSVICNSLYLLPWKTLQNLVPVIKASLEAGIRVPGTRASSWPCSPIQGKPLGRAFLLSFPAPLPFFWIRSWLFYEDPEGNGIIKSLAG